MPAKAPPLGKDLNSKRQKRKNPPSSSEPGPNQKHNRAPPPKRAKLQQSARQILTQASDAALVNGELDLQKFLGAREFEIKALEDGMRRSKGALATRAFQQVPRELRRRTASHNVKRVPKRLQKRAAREMKDDNTPTVTSHKKKPGSSRGRVRAETAKRLGLLAGKKRVLKTNSQDPTGSEDVPRPWRSGQIISRVPKPKTRRSMLNEPPKPPSKFRKRQIHKTWLPTHMYHAKRAKMTAPLKPLWRFAIPVTPTEKSYRSTHRATCMRGALCWDMSYMSTVCLEGTALAIEKVLRGIGLLDDSLWGRFGQLWRDGKRTWTGWLSRHDNEQLTPIGPATILWCAKNDLSPDEPISLAIGKHKKPQRPPARQLVIRIHPSVFLEVWKELLRLSKMQRPMVHVEDLRFEIGSIDLTGPDAFEALLGILHPFTETSKSPNQAHSKTFRSLAGVTNAAALPPDALLAFSVIDPRLYYPPRKLELPTPDDEETAFKKLETLSTWPVDEFVPASSLFDYSERQKATRLPSQKALNRRKALVQPGAYPSITAADPAIPIILYTSRTSSSSSAQGTWTLLAPWKCILPIWYGLMHYPLSSGGNPRFGGIQELQQIYFEQGKPWFPADFPGTQAGFAWECEERERRKKDWDARPKGKRTEFSSLILAGGKRGEIGAGWSCDFEFLLQPCSESERELRGTEDISTDEVIKDNKLTDGHSPFQQIYITTFDALLSNPDLEIASTSLATVCIKLLSRGVPQPCARIYRLPSSQEFESKKSSIRPGICKDTQLCPDQSSKIKATPADLRSHWLALASQKFSILKKSKENRTSPQKRKLSPSTSQAEYQRALAQDLLRYPPLQYPALNSEGNYPVVPGEEDLIGFVTTANFNLAEGMGTAIGSLLVKKVAEGLKHRQGTIKGTQSVKESRMCIVRNAGESVGRLAMWEPVQAK